MRCHRYSAPVVYLTTVEFRWTSNSNEVRKAADYAMEMAEQLKGFASCKGLDSRLCVLKRGQHRVGTCGQETHTLTPTCCMQTTMDMFVRGWTNCAVHQFECLSFCVNVHMCTYTRLNKIHGFGQNISFLYCAFSLYST